MPLNLAQAAEEIYHRALARVRVEARIKARVSCDAGLLRIGVQEWELESYQRIGVIAVGKAAAAMTDALVSVLGQSGELLKLEGVVVSGSEPGSRIQGFTYVTGGHPLPTEGSFQAADAVLGMLSCFGPEDLVIYLISGGASAMLERPLDSRFTLEDNVELYRALVHSGLPIGQMNCVRKHLSAVKGGRLALAANGATQVTLLISDVPGQDLSVIGSGPSLPDPSSAGDCRWLLEELVTRVQLSPRLRELLHTVALQETPKPGDAAFAESFYELVLSPDDVVEAAGEIARDMGFHVEVDNTCDDWDASAAAAYLLRRMRELRKPHGRVGLLSGGELSVPLPQAFGAGGRNQHFALACALMLEQSGECITVLSAGTDGLDGNSPAAGAVVSEGTCTEARSRGIDPERYLAGFDSHSFFKLMNAAVMTGPTGNNLRDLRILLSEA